MTSQPGLYCAVYNHILRSIPQSKGNQTMKFGHLIQHNKRNIFFFKNYAENEAGRLVPDLFILLKKLNMR